jgi:hypothetical protein
MGCPFSLPVIGNSALRLTNPHDSSENHPPNFVISEYNPIQLAPLRVCRIR